MNSSDLNEILTMILHQVERIFVLACETWNEPTDRCMECSLPAECNYRGLAAAYCDRHAKFDMDHAPALGGPPKDDFIKGYCTYMLTNREEPVQCSGKAIYGKLGSQPDRCRSHSEIGYINNPRGKCNHETSSDGSREVKCRKMAIHGGSFGHGADMCLEHFRNRRWEPVDPVLAACKWCGLPTMWSTQECNRCATGDGGRNSTWASEKNDDIREALAKLLLDGWQVDTFRPLPTYRRPIAYIRNHNRVIIVEYVGRPSMSEDLEEIPRMKVARETLSTGLDQAPDLQVAYLIASCGSYRYRGERNIVWKNALQETIEMVQSLMNNPDIWHRLSYVKLFHNHYARGSTFQAAEQIIIY